MTQYLVESQESALTPLLGGFDDDTDVIQSLDRHVPDIAKTVRGFQIMTAFCYSLYSKISPG